MVNINILELTKQIKEEGYDGEYVEAKLCQDIILLLIPFHINFKIKQ